MILVIGRAEHDRTHRLGGVAGVLRFDLIDQPIAFLQAIIRRHKRTVTDPRAAAQEKQRRQLAAVGEHSMHHGAIELFFADPRNGILHHRLDGLLHNRCRAFEQGHFLRALDGADLLHHLRGVDDFRLRESVLDRFHRSERNDAFRRAKRE